MVIKQLLSSATHCLHLCNNSNIDEIVRSYLIDADTFVTNNIDAWKKKFDENEIKCQIKSPKDVKQS